MKTRHHTIRLFEFQGEIDTQECIAFITKHLPLLKYHVIGFQGEIDEQLYTFLKEQNLSVVLLSGGIPKRPRETQDFAVNIFKDSQDESIVKSNMRPSALWIHKIVRSGEEVYHKGDIIIESRINSGARIITEGNLFLLEECRGSIEVNGDFIICRKIFTPALLFQGIIVDGDILRKINQSSALFKMIFRKDDNVAIKDLV